jgi:hypothetical protein
MQNDIDWTCHVTLSLLVPDGTGGSVDVEVNVDFDQPSLDSDPEH